MKEIYITGHRNPDLDSVCSAYGYAALKNTIDKNNHYTAVRCGHLSDVLKKQFEFLAVTPPPYMADVRPKVKDVMFLPSEIVKAEEPIYNLVKAYNDTHPSAFPVFHGDSYMGLLSIDDITSWFLKDNQEETPIYDFTLSNIESLLPGREINKGEKEFSAFILAGAAAYSEFTKIVTPNLNAVLVMGNRKRFIEYAMKMNVKAIIITTTDEYIDCDFSSYKGSVYATTLGTAEAIRRLRMSPPVSTIMGKQGVRLQVNDTYDEAKEALVNSKLRGLSVYEGDEWKGYVTSRSFLHKPQYEVILVDHNEVGQSIKGIEEATVLEILDHHRLDALKTSVPLFIDSEPLGSTCTIVYQQFLRHNLVPDENTAKMLLAGVISDTLILKSPTTTGIDRATAGALAAISGEYDIHAFGEKLFSFTDPLSSKDPESAINSDFKVYNEKGIKFGIGQCEVTTLKDVSSYNKTYLKALESVKEKQGLEWAMLLITDVLRDTSVLIATNSKLNNRLQWNRLEEGLYDLPGVMSRKKQLLPEVLYALD